MKAITAANLRRIADKYSVYDDVISFEALSDILDGLEWDIPDNAAVAIIEALFVSRYTPEELTARQIALLDDYGKRTQITMKRCNT